MSNRRTCVVASVVALSLVACGGSSSTDDSVADDVGSSDSPGTSESLAAAPEDVTPTSAADEVDEAPAVGTVTLGDGITYDLQIYQCGTNASGDYDLNGFANDVEVAGEPVEKIEINFGRTGDSFVSGRFEGKYSDGRQFAYSAKEPAALTVDVQTITGAVNLDGLGGPLGDSLDMTVDVTCGVLADPPPFS